MTRNVIITILGAIIMFIILFLIEFFVILPQNTKKTPKIQNYNAYYLTWFDYKDYYQF